MTSNLLVPVVLWGRHAPSHHISAILWCSGNTVVTGSREGHICIWAVDDQLKAIPMYILCGHSSKILCLTSTASGDSTNFVSSSESGEIFLWDSSDGRCLESSVSHHVHTNIISFTTANNECRLLCNGHYPEILILDSRSLTVLYFLASRVEPDWISSISVLRPQRRHDVVVGLTNSGMVKIWSISDEDSTAAPTRYEDESKQIKCTGAVMIRFATDNPRIMMVVCSISWQIYDASDFTLLISVPCPTDSAELFLRWTKFELLAGSSALQSDDAFLYCILKSGSSSDIVLSSEITYNFAMGFCGVVQADELGNVRFWSIPAFQPKSVDVIPQLPSTELPKSSQSMASFWSQLSQPSGIIDKLIGSNDFGCSSIITATLYVASQGRLILGRKDGSIAILLATHAIIRETLGIQVQNSSDDWQYYRVLEGHHGRVTCLLYPHAEANRYEPNHLVSGGADFCVCLWDLTNGTIIHRFCVQAGLIISLSIPPDTCNTRVLQSICSIASDHSVALLGLKELKCVLLASKHVFPVRQIRWRPLDDFMIVQTEDGSVYVWQMETCNLDRVAAGLLAEDIMTACQEVSEDTSDTQFGLPEMRNTEGIERNGNKSCVDSCTAVPLEVRSLCLSANDSHSHLLLLNVEALIKLLQDENVRAAAGSDSVQTFDNGDADSTSFSALLGKVKNTAETVGLKLQSTAENVFGVSPVFSRKLTSDADKGRRLSPFSSHYNLNMEIAQILLSFLHAWELDADLDKVCTAKLGLHRPSVRLCFGLISVEGYMSLLLPTAFLAFKSQAMLVRDPPVTSVHKSVHWSISTSLTTQHLLAVISVANTLMGIRNSSFVPEQEKRRRLFKRMSSSHVMSAHGQVSESEVKEALANEQIQIRQGWSLVAALHCVLLPDLVDAHAYKAPRIELLVRRWQERCFELREAAQALILRELNRIGPKGRCGVIKQWSSYLPTVLDPSVSIFAGHLVCAQPLCGASEDSAMKDYAASSSQDLAQNFWEPLLSAPAEPCKSNICNGQATLQEMRRNQATAVVLLGVVGAEFSNELCQTSDSSSEGIDYNSIVRAISQSLLELLLHPSTPLLPPFSPLRRAAVDLLGRGFAVWQPHLDMSKVLLGLLELSSLSDKLLPSGSVQFPLSPAADACRTARHSLTLIAAARPPALITALCKEVTRYNQLLQHQAQQQTVNSTLSRSKSELLRIVDFLMEKHYLDVVDLMPSIGEIIVFCLDVSLLKQKSLADLYPPVLKFNMIAYCPTTRRIAFGGKNGVIVVHELRVGKSQTIQAHSKPITAISFCEDGKMFASYSADEAKINFWQASQSFLGMGQSQIKLLKHAAAPSAFPVATPGGTVVPFRAKLVWISQKAITVMLPGGKEHRIAIS